jgi:hypothetical protein
VVHVKESDTAAEQHHDENGDWAYLWDSTKKMSADGKADGNTANDDAAYGCAKASDCCTVKCVIGMVPLGCDVATVALLWLFIIGMAR